MSLDEEHPDDEGEEFEEQPEAYFEGEDVDDVVDTPNEKLLRTSRIDVAEQPESYRNNTQKEELLLQYVANFRRQFEDLYPKRKPLMLCPRNECGMRKFICTSVRPTQVPFIELYDYDKCAAFVADFIKYEQLELPIALPQHMPSPTAVIEWQAGDCFDMAQVRKSPRPRAAPPPSPPHDLAPNAPRSHRCRRPRRSCSARCCSGSGTMRTS